MLIIYIPLSGILANDQSYRLLSDHYECTMLRLLYIYYLLDRREGGREGGREERDDSYTYSNGTTIFK